MRHCIQSGFGSVKVVLGAWGGCILSTLLLHPGSMLIKLLGFSPRFYQNLRWVPQGDARQKQCGVQAGLAVQLVAALSCLVSSKENDALVPAAPSTSTWVEVPFNHALLCPGPCTGTAPETLGQKPSKIQAKQMLPAALPKYLSLGWPEPRAGKAVVWCCEPVPEPSVLQSHPQIVTSWLSPPHRSLGTALSSPQPCSSVVPTRGQGRMAPSGQHLEEGLNSCCFLIRLLSLQLLCLLSLLPSRSE